MTSRHGASPSLIPNKAVAEGLFILIVSLTSVLNMHYRAIACSRLQRTGSVWDTNNLARLVKFWPRGELSEVRLERLDVVCAPHKV